LAGIDATDPMPTIVDAPHRDFVNQSVSITGVDFKDAVS
jgi:hypothetical protein